MTELPEYSRFYRTYDPNAVVVRPTVRIGLYARISAADDDFGVKRQIREGIAFLPRHPWLQDREHVIVDEYIDNDISAHDIRLVRPEFERLMTDLRTGRINSIWCIDYDRLARQELDAAFIKRDMALFQGELVLTNQPGESYDAVTGEGRLNWQFKTVIADNEVQQTKKRQKVQRKEKVMNGAFNGGKRRYGYDKTMATTVPGEVAIIREVADRMLAGESVCSLARELNARGVPTAYNGRWVATNLQRCVTGPHVAGLRLAYGGIAPTPASWPAILERETWHQLQVLISEDSRHKGVRAGRPKRVSPLTGLMWCGRCGKIARSIRVERGNSVRRYWQCNSPEGCKKINRSDLKLAPWIEGEVLAACANESYVRRLLVVADDGESHHELFDRKQEAERLLNELDGDYYNPLPGRRRIDRQLYESIRSQHERVIADCENKLDALTSKQKVDVALLTSGRLAECWPEMSVEEKHQIIKFAVHKIVLAPSVRAQALRREDHYKIYWADAPLPPVEI